MRDKNELFNQNINLAYYVANGYKRNHLHEIDDIRQIALMALWKATLEYDSRVRFSSFAIVVVKNAINQYLRKSKRNIAVSISQEIMEGITIEDTLQDDNDLIEQVNQKMDLEKVKNELLKVAHKSSPRDRNILDCILKGNKQTEIAQKYNLKQASVSRIKNKIVEKTRKIIA